MTKLYVELIELALKHKVCVGCVMFYCKSTVTQNDIQTSISTCIRNKNALQKQSRILASIIGKQSLEARKYQEKLAHSTSTRIRDIFKNSQKPGLVMGNFQTFNKRSQGLKLEGTSTLSIIVRVEDLKSVVAARLTKRTVRTKSNK